MSEEKKYLGVINFFFWKFNVQKKIFPKILVQKFFFSFFQKKIKTNHVIGVKFEFRMISAFIWCIYCLCRQKIMKFQNFVVSKLKFFVIKLGTFSRLVWKYYETYGCFQKLCGCLKISAFIWDHFWLIRVTNRHSTAHDIRRAESAPPWTICLPKSLNWIGLSKFDSSNLTFHKFRASWDKSSYSTSF